MEVCSCSYSRWWAYFWDPWTSFLQQISSQWGTQNFKEWCPMNLQPTFLILTSFWLSKIAILWKGLAWIRQLSETQLYQYFRSSFKFCWMWIFPWIKLTWHFCSMRDKLGWLGRLNFSERGYLPVRISENIWKISVTHMLGHGAYVKERLPFAQFIRRFSRFLFRSSAFPSFSSFNHHLYLPQSITFFILMVFDLT